jgi:lysyl endopeptidase
MNRSVHVALLLAGTALGPLPAYAQGTGPVKVGSVEAWGGGFADDGRGSVEAQSTTHTETIWLRGASFVRVHFRAVRLASGDVLTVARPDGGDLSRYTGRGPFESGSFWSLSVDGDTAVIRLERAAGSRGSRYTVSGVVRGTAPIAAPAAGETGIQTICGNNGLENVACRLPEANAAQRAVARLNFISNGGSFVCTGSLVRGANASTLITNNHCVDNQAETQTVEARFNFQTASCAGGAMAPAARFAGLRFLRTSPSLDYTLLTLSGSPETTWGELIPTSRSVSAGQRIWLVQHPGGQPKKIGYFEDAGKTQRCDVESVRNSVGGYATRSQMRYSCDTAGGSSGSPVIAAGSTRVIGLHHLGGCRNSGTHMSNICAHAGSLLQCAAD